MQKQTVKKISGLALGSSMLLLSMIPAASAFAATAPAVTSVTLTSSVAKTATATVGSNVTFTASATQTGSGTPMYQFWTESPNGTWTATGWSSSNTYTLKNVQTGSYEVVAYAADKGQTTPISSESTYSNQFVNVGTSLTFTTNANDVAPLSPVTITATAKNFTNVVYQYWIGTPNGNGGYNWVANGDYTTSNTYTFTPSTPGSYKIAVYAKDLNAPQDAQFANSMGSTEAVYGAPAAVQLKAASSSLVADGQATDTITATVVDANGNTVGNYTGTVSVTGVSSGTDANTGNAYVQLTNGGWLEGGSVSGNTETFNVTNGKAQITLVAGNAVATNSDTIIATGTTPTGTTLQFGSATVSYTAQVASALKLTPASNYLGSNAAGTEDAVSVQAVDQNGVAMTSGTYTASVSLTGNAQFVDGTKGPETLVFGPSGATVYVEDLQGNSGTIDLTATGTGLANGTAQISEGVAGALSKATLSLSSASVTADAAAQGDASSPATTLTVNTTDANGFPVSYTGTADVSVTYDGSASTAFGVAGAAAGTLATQSSGVWAETITNGTVQIPLAGTSTVAAGTYTVTVSSPTNAFPTASQSVTVTPGAAYGVQVSPTINTNVTEGQPQTTVTASVVDKEGNVVPGSGTEINFFIASQSGTGAELNGSAAATAAGTPVSVMTNSAGSASVTLTLPGTLGNSATVEAYEGAVAASPAAGTTATSGTVSVVGASVTNVSVTGPTSSVTSGSAASFAIKTEDTYGDLLTGDTVQITVPTGLSSVSATNGAASPATVVLTAVPGTTNEYTATMPASGEIVLTGTTSTTGNYTVTAQDLSSPTKPQGSATANVTAGTLSAVQAFNTSGTNLSLDGTSYDTVAAGGSEAVTFKTTDAAGNVVSPNASYTVTLPTSANWSWRSTLNGADISNITLAPSQTAVTVYLVNNETSSITVGESSQTVNLATSDLTVANTATTITPAQAALTFSAKNTTLTDIVTVADAGGALAGQTVTWSISSTGTGSATASGTAVTNSNGQITIPVSITTYNGTDTNTLKITVGSAVNGSTPTSTTVSITD